MTWRASLRPLRERNFRWYFLSRFVNTLGNMMAGVALAFAVLDITDSATALGQVLAAHTIPMVVFLLWGGVIADRFPRVPIIQVSNLVSGAHAGRHRAARHHGYGGASGGDRAQRRARHGVRDVVPGDERPDAAARGA